MERSKDSNIKPSDKKSDALLRLPEIIKAKVKIIKQKFQIKVYSKIYEQQEVKLKSDSLFIAPNNRTSPLFFSHLIIQ